ncbi:unnamed protein product [Aureobasidium mustum]|uniref:Uncharacterized protein n=1 Tax=Aureobasidium mustum TaxID=2773714 RepID=A0A9N8JXJ3_9PEZI|nr:unnamed protein product [Aureobasidium mustum]
MSDTSGDSSVGVKCDAVDTLDQHNDHSADQTSGSRSNSESDSDSSSEEGDGGILVEATPVSKRLGYVDIFAMKTKMDGIHAWLREVINESTEDHVYVHKPTLRYHKRAMDSMRRCLEDAAPMAVKYELIKSPDPCGCYCSSRISQYMDASVKKYVTTQLDKTFEKMTKSEGSGSAAMKELLAQSTFKPNLVKDIEQDVLKDDKFPHKKPNVLNAEIGEIVNSHLGAALLKHAQKQTEAKLLKKFNADTKKALEGLKEELKGAGLMK